MNSRDCSQEHINEGVIRRWRVSTRRSHSTSQFETNSIPRPPISSAIYFIISVRIHSYFQARNHLRAENENPIVLKDTANHSAKIYLECVANKTVDPITRSFSKIFHGANCFGKSITQKYLRYQARECWVQLAAASRKPSGLKTHYCCHNRTRYVTKEHTQRKVHILVPQNKFTATSDCRKNRCTL